VTTGIFLLAVIVVATVRYRSERRGPERDVR
jgi:hypothetical protein